MVRIFKNIKELFKAGFLAFIFASASIFLLGLHNQFMPPFMIGWLVFWLIEFISGKAIISIDDKRTLFLLYFFLGLNLIFILGLFFSDDFHTGSVLFFRRLSMLIFPIILFSPGTDIKKRVGVLLKVFVIGIVVFLAFCFFYALFRSVHINGGNWNFDPVYPEQPWLNYFYGQLLSLDQHPSYIAMYSLLGMFISLEFFSYQSLKFKTKVLWLLASLFLFVSVYFLSSRASFLVILLVLPVFLWIKFRPNKFNKLAALTLIILIGLVSLVYLKNQRVKIYYDKSLDPAVLNDGRAEIWKSALKVIQKNPLFGDGIGDYYNDLDKMFKESGYTTGYYKDFNAHNQYLEILCISGIVGFLLFLTIVGLIISYAIKDRNVLYGAFIIMMLIFFSFESMLSRFAGNSFFALFSFLLIHYKGPEAHRNSSIQNQD